MLLEIQVNNLSSAPVLSVRCLRNDVRALFEHNFACPCSSETQGCGSCLNTSRCCKCSTCARRLSRMLGCWPLVVSDQSEPKATWVQGNSHGSDSSFSSWLQARKGALSSEPAVVLCGFIFSVPECTLPLASSCIDVICLHLATWPVPWDFPAIFTLPAPGRSHRPSF